MKSQTFTRNFESRRQFLGGSDARIIMSPDESALIRLWKEKRGEAEPEDLSDNLIVQLGVATEPLNRTWYERNAGRAVTDVQRWVRHPVHRYLAATLDGFVNALDAVFEAYSALGLAGTESLASLDGSFEFLQDLREGIPALLLSYQRIAKYTFDAHDLGANQDINPLVQRPRGEMA